LGLWGPVYNCSHGRMRRAAGGTHSPTRKPAHTRAHLVALMQAAVGQALGDEGAEGGPGRGGGSAAAAVVVGRRRLWSAGAPFGAPIQTLLRRSGGEGGWIL